MIRHGSISNDKKYYNKNVVASNNGPNIVCSPEQHAPNKYNPEIPVSNSDLKSIKHSVVSLKTKLDELNKDVAPILKSKLQIVSDLVSYIFKPSNGDEFVIEFDNESFKLRQDLNKLIISSNHTTTIELIQTAIEEIRQELENISGTEEIHIGDDEPVGDNFKIWIPSSDEPIIEESELVPSYATFSLRRGASIGIQDDFSIESASTYTIEEENEVYEYVNSDSENSVTRTYVIEEEEEEEVYEYVATDSDNNVVNTYEITSNSRTYPYYSEETGLVYNK